MRKADSGLNATVCVFKRPYTERLSEPVWTPRQKLVCQPEFLLSFAERHTEYLSARRNIKMYFRRTKRAEPALVAKQLATRSRLVFGDERTRARFRGPALPGERA
jgi:hypothetical protein